MEATTRTGERQAKLWGARARDWAELHEPLVQSLYDAVLDALDVKEGTQHLDLGCGSGRAAQIAASRGAQVSGLDATPELLEIARERVPDGDFHQGDLEELPFEDDRFDTVAGFNSFQFAGNPATALSEAARVAKPEAPIAVATWGRPEQCEAAAVLGAYASLMPPPPPGAVGPFALSEPGRLEGFVEQAGLQPAVALDVETVWDYSDLAEALRAFNSVGPATMARTVASEDEIDAKVGAVLQQFRQSDGSIRLTNVFRYLIARTA
jgi:ubiquinone/menaquinone biosynthesis C-methylase UbiE